MKTVFSSFRIVLATWAVCVLGYGGLILVLGQTLSPESANGSLIRNTDGEIVGSRQLAQAFTRARYFWPRLSAVGYDGASAGGSNLSPTNAAITDRAIPVIEALGGTAENPVPSDLVTASGSGLDPHISLGAALYQIPRIATARNRDRERIKALVESRSFSPGGFLTEEKIVNVLELNLALDQSGSEP